MRILINLTVVTIMVTLSGIFGLKSQKTENLSETAKANIEALESINDAVPDECKGCSTFGAGKFCCNYYFNGEFITLYQVIENPEDPIF